MDFLASLAGGSLIGCAAALFWLLSGRVAGVSGIAGGLLAPRRGDFAWRALFLAGLATGGLLASRLWPDAFGGEVGAPAGMLILAGLLVGFGTGRASGCTSGHGVCGVARLSPRSLAATGTFMATGVATVYVLHHLLGGFR
jgi:uncharacterized membrane protein YedE/YeeE